MIVHEALKHSSTRGKTPRRETSGGDGAFCAAAGGSDGAAWCVVRGAWCMQQHVALLDHHWEAAACHKIFGSSIACLPAALESSRSAIAPCHAFEDIVPGPPLSICTVSILAPCLGCFKHRCLPWSNLLLARPAAPGSCTT